LKVKTLCMSYALQLLAQLLRAKLPSLRFNRRAMRKIEG